MKTNIAVLSFLICIVMVTTAVKADTLLSPNGDFSGGTHVGRGGHIMPLLWDNANNRIDGGWGNTTVAADYNTGGYVVAKIDATNAIGGYAVVFQDPRTSLAALGIPEALLPFTINFSADINDLIPGGGGPGAILKLECYDACGVCTNPNPTSCGDERQIATSGSTWANYLQTYNIPVGTKSVNFVFGVSTGWGAPYPTKPSSFAFDNLKIGLYYYGTSALYPVPIIGGAQNLPNNVISWTNPEGAVNADVYMQASTTPLANPDPRLTGTRIAHDINAESLTVSSLLVNRYYYWVVDVNMGSPAGVVSGFTWDFHTTNLNVEAGPNQYLVRTASPKTLILNATVTSDNAIATYAWTDITLAANKDPYTTVTIVSPTTEDTNVTLTNTEPNHTVDGWYQFTLTVTDVQGNIAADTVNVGVYSTCAAAAIANPDDNYDGVADFNGDCKVDLADFAIFAGKWLACDLLRRPCP